ncbi:trypsin-like peptidase domain-containing protein [Brevibacillus laterosporus]|uniref:S1C family serine protease n=1 Tax=Brevibacillus laterosporus TaxID=1465 RepID=UPI0018CE6CD7|nr:trypsin-like peptidase domain-containing protein [Brevibacillus laterosporus]MBG9796706.1 serine protease [Brevibacillus laterosporus]MCR8936667.1 trypsin-like peptidase domain-containing protein [Brevibacillus laterosporus]MCZ0839306.1 trypsin-like peptidase domain-containing protein [Brevibacillus laterosporus]MCZ0844170.1 trypsin-like peptidase domain-containing protein [Brevibacillus laterosporus]MED1910972.1 trypsin-like peptidase domain-containing protein [Brevibacillus laterosporus]
MGYYDNDDFYEMEPKKKASRSGMGKYIVTSVTSAVIGGLVVLMLTPAISKTGYLNLPLKTGADANQAAVTASTISTKTNQPVSVNVETAITSAVEKTEDAVVGITNIKRVANLWTRQTGNVAAGVGSGVIFEKKDGKAHIITNNHVVQGAQSIEVSLASGDKVTAKVLGADAYNDLAVLEIDGSKVTKVAELGDSSTLKVGEPTIAIGNPLGLDFSRTVTQGIISSKSRSMPTDVNDDGIVDWELDVIQTDAAINPGNSGGALVNIYGQVIGINTLKISREGVEGLGFAIPINDVKNIIPRLMQDGYLKRAYLGVTPRDLTDVPKYAWKEVLNLPNEVTTGVVAMEVGSFSPASKGGLKQYDVITQLDDTPINSSAQLLKYFTLNKKAGETVSITLYRDGFKKEVKVTLGEKPQQNQEQLQPQFP